MQKSKIFVSHVSEEAALANIFKTHLSHDFLGLFDIFVSSDLESIAAGDNWLVSLEEALREASVLLVLCSHASLNRPWVNFEVGAGWIKSIPIVPICHSGLNLRELPIPLSLLQGIQANTEDGWKILYTKIAKILDCQVPKKDYSEFVKEVSLFEQDYVPQISEMFKTEIKKRTSAKTRINEALADPKHGWRSIERLAILSGLTEDETLELLIQDSDIVFGKDKNTGRRIARLKSREPSGKK
jgi:hypothetical protein